MRNTQPLIAVVRQWWFAIVLVIALVCVAVIATPQGQGFVANAASNAGAYYQYLSIIFKS